MNEKDVPLIGQPVTMLTWYPTAVLRCNCRETPMSLVITTGIRNTVLCGNCGKGYFIQGIRPNGSLDVGILLPAPTGTVQ